MKTYPQLVMAIAFAAAGITQAQETLSWKACLSQKPQWYSSDEAVRIADNVLLFQRNTGGWPKNTEMADVLDDKGKSKLKSQKADTDSTIDNGATCRQLNFLAKIYNATHQKRYSDAFLKGIDFLLVAQYDNGGWPQFYPVKKGYYTHITFNDGAMINVMTLLGDIRDRKTPFSFVDEQRRIKAKTAVDKGIECILKCQITVDGTRLAWCAQHDEKNFAPRPARSYERASLSGAEGVGIVKYLMTIESPSPKIIASIESAVTWFDKAGITGIRETSNPAPGTPKGYDKVIVTDPDAPPIWARFYQIGTNRPIFCSRDGIIRASLADISYERRNGYSWYTTAPADLLTKTYPAWQKKHTPGRNVLTDK